MLKAAIFDVDGTLVDSNELHARAWQEAFRHVGCEIPVAEIRRQIGKGGDQLIPVFLRGDDLRRHGAAVDREKTELFLRKYLPQVRAFAGVRELFARLHAQGTRIVLAGSAKDEELAAYKRLCPALSRVDEQTSSEDAERSKPEPDILAAALQRVRVKPEEAVAVGDTPYDAIAAIHLNLPIVGVLCGGFRQQELREAGCRTIYRDPEDLLANFDRSPLAGKPARAA
jgi:HAD superfamily hydrolase (TIGR01509 family)